jgi:hypothetical protein
MIALAAIVIVAVAYLGCKLGVEAMTIPTPDALCGRLRRTRGINAALCHEAAALIQQQQATLECARLDLNHLAEKYGEQEFIAPTICKITALGKDASDVRAQGEEKGR